MGDAKVNFAPPETPEPLPDPEWGYLKIVKLFNK